MIIIVNEQNHSKSYTNEYSVVNYYFKKRGKYVNTSFTCESVGAQSDVDWKQM